MTGPVHGRLKAALADRYRIERELGAGGMATVYLAQDLKHDREVAIKVLHPDLAAALGGERFLAEIKTTARLQHPHILPLLDSGAADGFLYYVMPYVAGETLRARLERERQLPLHDALRIGREVADALGAAHLLGIIHRDIKPENILLQGGHALVADFGIALAVQTAGGARMTQTGLSLGTPQYMSPEQAMGERTIDARTDQYALGAVTYEMIGGEPPFTGASVQAIIAKALSERPVPLRTLRDTVPAGVEQAVLRALAKLPADRFSSVLEFSRALGGDGSAEWGATGPARTAGRDGVFGKRRGGVIAAAGVMVSLALAGGWTLGRKAASQSSGSTNNAIFDAALPDSTPLSSVATIGATGFGSAKGNLSIAFDGSFFVYTAQRGDSVSLWYRSLVDASTRRITGTDGGTAARISPDGKQLVFVTGTRTLLVPIEGGEPRRLIEGDLTHLQWISNRRLVAIASDGYRVVWVDPESGVVEERALGQSARCVFGQWIEEEKLLLCSFDETARLVDPRTLETRDIRIRSPEGTPGATVSGSGFRLIDGDHLIWVSIDGELRAAPYDAAQHTIGRSVTMVSGIKRDALGAVHYDLAANGLLGYVPAVGPIDGRMVELRPGSAPRPLGIESGAFLRFDLAHDRRRLAAVVATPQGQELRIYDLRGGQRQVWLSASAVRFPAWSPSGDRIAVRVEDGGRSVLLLGSPSSSLPPDTLMVGDEGRPALDVLDFPDDRTLIARDLRSAYAMRIDISKRPVVIDTLFDEGVFVAISPDGRRVAWHTSTSSQLFVGDYPPNGKRVQVNSGAIEPMWLSPTELLYRSSVTWYLARFDPVTGDLIGAPTKWGEDPNFLDTPGWSNRPTHDGGVIYSQSAGAQQTRYLRFVPNFVGRMKAAVAKANR